MSSSEPSVESKVRTSSASETKRRKGCGCWTILLVLLLFFVVLPLAGLVGTYVVLTIREGQALEAELARAREAGYPLTLEELEAEYPTSPEIEAATAHWQRALEIVGSEEYKQAAVGVPIVEVGERTKEAKAFAPLEGDDLARAKAFLATYRKAIEEANAAKEAGAVARYPVDFESQPLAKLEHVDGLRALARLLRLEVETQLVDGDAAGAVDAILTTIAAGESLSNEPLMLSQLVRVSILEGAVESTAQLLARSDGDDAQLARLQNAFDGIDTEDAFRRALDGERVIALRTIEGAAAGGPQVEEFRWFSSVEASSAKSLEIFRQYAEANEGGTLALFEADEAIVLDIDRLFGDQTGSLRATLAIVTLPSLSVASHALLRCEAHRRLAVTGLACARYRTAEGSWPATLDELVPSYLEEIPLDPFDERALRYRVESNGVLLYSVGRNQSDEDGLDDAWDGDLVFRIGVPDEGLPAP